MMLICRGLFDYDLEIECVDKYISIGSSDANELTVKATGVSACHAFIIEKNGKYYIKDNNSRNGTYVDTKRVVDEQELLSGNIIQLGLQQI